MHTRSTPIPWLTAGQAFPPVTSAWPECSAAPGLLAAGSSLAPTTLIQAYSQGIYPWFNEGDPPLWWSPDPRMVLHPTEFRLHRSLRQAIGHYIKQNDVCIRFDTAFSQVMRACASSPRQGKQVGTWIHPQMIDAYSQLAAMKLAHSVEVWRGSNLVAGLYCMGLGRAVFGESMFTTISNGSKIALTALVQFCRLHDVDMIDCQQQTDHLAFMGAKPISRSDFCENLRQAVSANSLPWPTDPANWMPLQALLT